MHPTGPLRYWMRMDANPGFWGLHARGLVGIAGMAAVAFGTWQLGQWIASALPEILAWPLAALPILVAFAVNVSLFDRLLLRYSSTHAGGCMSLGEIAVDASSRCTRPPQSNAMRSPCMRWRT